MIRIRSFFEDKLCGRGYLEIQDRSWWCKWQLEWKKASGSSRRAGALLPRFVPWMLWDDKVERSQYKLDFFARIEYRN
jgi:hypothetical protein